MEDVSGMAVTFRIQQLSLHVIDPFHACVRSLLMSQPLSRLTRHVTSLDKFVMLSQVSGSISARPHTNFPKPLLNSMQRRNISDADN